MQASLPSELCSGTQGQTKVRKKWMVRLATELPDSDFGSLRHNTLCKIQYNVIIM